MSECMPEAPPTVVESFQASLVLLDQWFHEVGEQLLPPDIGSGFAGVVVVGAYLAHVYPSVVEKAILEIARRAIAAQNPVV